MSDALEHDIMAVEVGPDDPATDVAVETLRSGLTSEHSAVRLRAANVASFVPHEDVETLNAVTSELIDLLWAEQSVTIHQSVIALGIVSQDEPELLEDGVSRFVELLEHDHSHIRAESARCLANVANERPEYVVDEVEGLTQVTVTEPGDAVDEEAIEDPDLARHQRESLQTLNYEEGVRRQMARDVAANLLVEVAKDDPSEVTPHLEELTAVLDEGPLTVQIAVVDAIAQVAQDDPDAGTPFVGQLRDLLDYPAVQLVATAITALGFIGDDAAVEPLRELAADEEREEDLRDLASETATFIEEQ